VHLNQLDTHDQVTDYEAATPHAKALEKLQELNLTITRPAYRKNLRPLQKASAFEPEHDHTARALDTTPAKNSDRILFNLPRRWKRRGPALREMCDADFQHYLETEVQHKTTEFLKVLKANASREFVENMTAKCDRENLDIGKLYYEWLRSLSDDGLRYFMQSRIPDWMPESLNKHGDHTTSHSMEPLLQEDFPTFEQYFSEASKTRLLYSDYTQDQVADELKQVELDFVGQTKAYWRFYLLNFRKSSGLNARHRELIEEIFDLPATVLTEQRADAVGTYTTHPSAGLSYRRTAAVVNNHPVFGPLKQQVHQGRILLSKHRTNIDFQHIPMRLGLAGVAVSKDGSTPLNVKLHEKGSEIQWLTLSSAEINAQGKLLLLAKPPAGRNFAIDGLTYVAKDSLFRQMWLDRQKELQKKLHIRTLSKMKGYDGNSGTVGDIIETLKGERQFTDDDEAFLH
jgi:hypothetical protein